MTGKAAARAAKPPSRAEAEASLKRVGASGDAGIDIAEAALMFAALERPRIPLDRYRAHLKELSAEVRRRCRTVAGTAARAEALAAVLHDEAGYRGDELTYDDLQNANLMRVIDRRKGLPVALGILYLHAARAQGWHAFGLNFPGHFLIGIEGRTKRVILDPFAGTPVEGASALRGLLKAVAGMGAELAPENYAPMANRAILLRLENNIKMRLAATARFAEAAVIAQRMLLVAPDEVSLYRDLGLYHAEARNLGAAIEALAMFIARSPDEAARHQASALARRIRSRLN